MSVAPALAIFLYSWAGVRGLCQEGSLAASAVHRGKELLADPFEFLRMSSVNTLINCARLCLARSECRSFTYNDGDRTCKAFTITSDDTYPLQTSRNASVTYVEADQLPKILGGPCGNRPCQPFEACIEESLITYSCAAIGRCTSAPQLPNTDVTELSDISAEYACNGDYVSTNKIDASVEVGSNFPSWCVGNNIWTAPNISCTLNPCLTPPTLINADLVSFVPGTAMYICSSGYINVQADTDTIFSSSCTSAYTWTTPNYKCSDTTDCYYYNSTKGRAIYSGALATASTGEVCRAWSTTSKSTDATLASVSSETVEEISNYCRDADVGFWNSPWCYNNNGSPMRCDIPRC